MNNHAPVYTSRQHMNVSSLVFMRAAPDTDVPRLQGQVLQAATWQLLPLIIPVLTEAFKVELQRFQVWPST
jgi:hypothetical protein